MWNFPLRHLTRLTATTIRSLRCYPKLTFFGVAAATASYAFSHTASMPDVPGKKLQQNSPKPSISLETFIPTIKKDLPLVEFKARPPLYPDKARIYEGYPLLKILSEIPNDKANNDLVVLICKDGFMCYISRKFIEKNNPIVAVRQKFAPPGQDWEMVDHPLGGKNTQGGPFYLMWPENAKNVGVNHWPFGVIALRFGSFQEIFGKITPRNPEPVIQRGFRVFAENCACCHTLGGQGTSVGPPMESIVRKFMMFGTMSAYAQNPKAFNRSSAMPEQDLKEEELRAAEKYIREEVRAKA